ANLRNAAPKRRLHLARNRRACQDWRSVVLNYSRKDRAQVAAHPESLTNPNNNLAVTFNRAHHCPRFGIAGIEKAAVVKLDARRILALASNSNKPTVRDECGIACTG